MAASKPGCTCIGSASRPRMPGDASGDQRCRAVLLVERQRQRLRARGERVALAFAAVQLLADALDLGLGLEHRSLRELVRLVEVGLGGLARVGGRLGLGERRCRARPALGRASSAFSCRSTSPRTAASLDAAVSAWPASLESSRS